jgi:membrane peptidoglycan carboxypeptidase
MQRAIQTRRQRLRRLRELQSGTAGKTAAGAATFVLLAGIVLMASAAGLAFSVYSGYVDDLPSDPTTAFARDVLGPAQIFDRHGTLLYEFEDENDGLRNPVPLRNISQWAIKATVATEDNNFYENPGVNVRGLARAALENFTDSDDLFQGSGGSSITQQLVKNVFIAEQQRYERSADRKMKEAAIALELTRRYDKDQILEWYLNQIHYGNRTNGIEAAARRYFGVHASDLTLAQAALLAGLPQAPARYDPFRNPEAAVQRQHEVLDLMVRHGHITEVEAEAAKAEPVVYQQDTVDLLAPHWVFYVRDQLIARYGEDMFRSGGLRVTTSLDLNLNNRAEQILRAKVSEYEAPPYNCLCHNGSVVAIDNKTGEILAMVGSRDYYRTDIEGENNNAIAIKQPGSAFKPIVYLSAFMKGWNPGTIIYDQATRFFARINERGQREYFTPVGPNRVWHGPQSARNSLGNSLNTAANKAAGFAGVDYVIDVAHKVGISTLTDREVYGVSISTGGANLTLLDLTFAYSVLSNNGEMRGTPAIGPRPGIAPSPDLRHVDPVSILRVETVNGEVLFDIERERAKEQVVPAGFAYQITDILKDNDSKRLTYSYPDALFSVGDQRPVAAKTGTQQGLTNLSEVLYTWNIGYIPDLSIGVWVGNADNKPVNPNLTSASSSALIWKDLMIEAIKMYNIPPKDFPVPPDIEWRMINGKREPIVKSQQRLICVEDLRLWREDNPTMPIPGGAQMNPECQGGNAVLCQEAPATSSTATVNGTRTATPSARLFCPTATVTPSATPSDGTPVDGAQPVTRPATTPVPQLRPVNAGTAPAPLPPAPTIPAPRIPAATPAPVAVPIATPPPAPAPVVTPAPALAPAPQATSAPIFVPPSVATPAAQSTPQPIFVAPTVVLPGR